MTFFSSLNFVGKGGVEQGSGFATRNQCVDTKFDSVHKREKEFNIHPKIKP